MDFNQVKNNLLKGFQQDVKPFMRTFTIIPNHDGTYEIHDTDGYFSMNNSMEQLEWFFNTLDYDCLNDFNH